MRPAGSVAMARSVLSALLMTLIAAAFVPAQERGGSSPARSSETPVKYRRIFWPSDQLERLSGRYLPMRRSEFDDRIDRLRGPAQAGPIGDRPLIHWQATVSPTSGIQGTAYVDLAEPAQKPAWVSIQIPLGIAAFGLALTGSDSPPTGGFDAQGRLRLRVDSAQRLSWRWSAAPQERAPGLQRFTFLMPEGWWSTWDLEPVSGWTLMPEGSAVPLPTADPLPDGSDSAAERVQWITRPQSTVGFVLERADGKRPGDLVQQTTEHHLSAAGLSTVTRWNLAPHRIAYATLVVETPPGMTATYVHVNGQPVGWHQQGNQLRVFGMGDDDRGLVPERRTVQVGAEMPWPLGQATPLPRLHLVGSRAVEHVQLRVDDALAVGDLQMQGGNYLGPDEVDGPLHRFRFDEPGDQAIVTAGWLEVHLRVASGVSVQLNPSLARASVMADIAATQGSCFQLRIRLLGQWTVNNVSSISAEDRVAQWREITEGSDRWLEIRLRDALSPLHPVRLAIQAQLHDRFLAADPPMQLSQLRPLEWPPEMDRMEWYSFRAIYPYRLIAVEPAAVDWLSVEDMSTQQLQLLSAQPGDWLMEGNPQNLAFPLRLTQEQPRLTARTQVQVSLHRDQRLHRYRVELQPGSSSAVRRVSVDIFPAGNDELRWQMERPGSTNLLVRRVADGQTPPGVERWEIELPEAVREPFTLIAERTVRGSAGSRIALLRVNGAAEQLATVMIGVIDPLPVRITQQGPLEAMAVEPASTIRFRRQYSYAADQMETIDLRVQLDPAAAPPGVFPMWIWLARVETELSRAGRSKQRVHLYVENHGASQLAIQVPPTVIVRGMTVNGREARWSEEAGRVVIGIPREERFLEILTDLQLEGLPLPTLGRLVLSGPQIDVPVLKWQWVHWLPAGYAPRPSGWATSATVPFAAPSSDVRPLLDHLAAVRAPLPGNRAAAERRQLSSPDADSAEADLLASNGWTPVVDQTMRRTTELAVYRPLPFRLLSVVAFLCMVGIHATFLRERPRTASVLALVAGASWLVLPVPYSSCAAAVALALVLGMLLSATSVRSSHRPSEARPAERSASRSTAVAGCLAGLVLLAATHSPGMAADVPQSGRSVLVPIDHQGNPVGEYVYLPKDFYDSLTAQSSDPFAAPVWAIKQAMYRVDADGMDLAATDGLLPVTARWQLATFRSDVNVHFPLPSSLVRQMRVDGRAALWTGDTREIRMRIGTMGDHLVEASLAVPWGTSGSRRAARLPIPPVPDAQLLAQWPTATGPLDVAPLASAPSWNGDHTLLEARLPLTEQLTLQWQPESELKQTVVDQALWLQADAQRIVLTARFRVRAAAASPLEELILTTDQPLVATAPAGSTPTVAPQRQFRVPLARGADGELRGQVQWTIDHSGGWTRIPAVTVEGGKAGDRFLAVSMAAGLICQADWLTSGDSASPSRFQEVWGALVSPPDTIVPWDESALDAYLLIRRPAIKPPVSSLLQYSIDTQRMEVWLEAAVDPQGMAMHQLRVRVPADWVPQQVDAFHNGQPLKVKWTRSDPETLNLFIFQVPSDSFVVVVKGRMETALQKPFLLPLLTIDGCILKNCQLRLFSRPETLVSVIRQEGFQRRVDEEDEWLTPVDEKARLVADLVTSQADAQAEVTVVPNHPVSDHDLVLTVQAKAGGEWRGELRHHVRVRQGELRQVRYEVPSDWVGQMTMPENMDVQVRPTLHPDRVQLVADLHEPLLKEGEWQWEVPMEVSAVGSVRIPLIRMELEGSTSGRVEVPAQIGNRPIQWVGRGIEELTGTDDQPLPAGTRRFEVVDTNYALSGNIEAPTAEAQIYMEDLYFQWRDAQGAIAWIAYDLHSGGAASCDLRLPQGTTLVQVSVDDQPALAELRGKNRWEVVLGTTRYPQRMTLILKYDAPQHAGVQPIDLPELRFGGGKKRVVAQQRLVTVVSPGQAGPAMGSAALRAVGPGQLRELRRKHLEDLIRSNWPTAGTGRETTELAAWQARLKELQDAGDSGLPSSPSGPAPASGGEVHLGLGGGPERWRWILGSDVRYTCLVSPSQDSRITLHYPRDTNGAGRWLAFAAGLAGAVWIARRSTWQWIQPQMSRYLPAGMVLAGLLISQSVWPAFLGWLVAAGGVWAAAWPLWAGRRLRSG